MIVKMNLINQTSQTASDVKIELSNGSSLCLNKTYHVYELRGIDILPFKINLPDEKPVIPGNPLTKAYSKLQNKKATGVRSSGSSSTNMPNLSACPKALYLYLLKKLFLT